MGKKKFVMLRINIFRILWCSQNNENAWHIIDNLSSSLSFYLNITYLSIHLIYIWYSIVKQNPFINTNINEIFYSQQSKQFHSSSFCLDNFMYMCTCVCVHICRWVSVWFCALHFMFCTCMWRPDIIFDNLLFIRGHQSLVL